MQVLTSQFSAKVANFVLIVAILCFSFKMNFSGTNLTACLTAIHINIHIIREVYH